MSLLEIPHELVVRICHELDQKDVLVLASTCKELLVLRRDNTVWKQFYEEQFGGLPKSRQEKLAGHTFSWAEEFVWRSGITHLVVCAFNKKDTLDDAIAFLYNEGIVITPVQLHTFLTTEPGVSKKKLMAYLLQSGELALKEYIASIELEGLQFLDALRKFFKAIQLPSELTNIKVVWRAFSEAYYLANADVLSNWTEEDVYLLCHSVMVLNVDAHNPRVTAKMSANSFASTVSGYCGVSDEVARNIYESVVRQRFVMGDAAAAPLLEVDGKIMAGMFSTWKSARMEIAIGSLSIAWRDMLSSDPTPLRLRAQDVDVTVCSVGRQENCVVISSPDGLEGVGQDVAFAVSSRQQAHQLADSVNTIFNTAHVPCFA